VNNYGPTRKKVELLLALNSKDLNVAFARVFANTLDRITEACGVPATTIEVRLRPRPHGKAARTAQLCARRAARDQRESIMEPPLQAILIAGEEVQARVEEGYKAITIREGTRDYMAGRAVLLGCDVVGWAKMAIVTSVRFTTVGGLTSAEVHDDGFSSTAAALAGLRQFYPDLKGDSPVTVIRWELVE
jgi:hypothetical protein